MEGLRRRGRFGLALLALAIVCVLPLNAGASSTRWGLVYARVVERSPARYLMLRINEPGPAARVRVALIAGKHRVVKTVVRTVGTNRRVRVVRLAIPRKVRTVRIRVLRLIG